MLLVSMVVGVVSVLVLWFALVFAGHAQRQLVAAERRAADAEQRAADLDARLVKALELWNDEIDGRRSDVEQLRARLDALAAMSLATVRLYRNAFAQLT